MSKDKRNPNSSFEDWKDAAIMALLLAVLGAFLWLCAGCRSSGVRIVASSSTYTNLAEINYDEYKWPVFSFISGPKVTVWVNREYGAIRSVTASGSVTNTTSALALYDSTEQKTVDLAVTFAPTNTPTATATATTNAVTEAATALAAFTNSLDAATAVSGTAP